MISHYAKMDQSGADDASPMDVDAHAGSTPNTTGLSSSTDLQNPPNHIATEAIIVPGPANNEALASCDESKLSCSPDYGIGAAFSSGSDEGFNQQRSGNPSVRAPHNQNQSQHKHIRSFGDLFDDDDLD